MKKYILSFLIAVLFITPNTFVQAKTFQGELCQQDQQLTQNLKRGARDGRYHWYARGIVRQAHILQAHLNRLGFASGKVDGILGPISDGAIKRMQRFLGVKADGYVGPITRNALNHSCHLDEQNNSGKNSENELPFCVYNNAYQENYENDKIADIIENAKNCYVLIDPFTNNAYQSISQIKEKENQVGCYMSAGTGEDWRDDFNELKPYLVKKVWGEWAGEYFVNRASTTLKNIMKKRIQKFANFGCDWVEFDNMDWAGDDENREEYDLEISYNESKEYIKELCTYTKSLGMKCMAKSSNYGDALFDGLTIESYSDEKDWWEKSELKNILKENKLGLIVHYDEKNCDAVYEDYKNEYGDKLSFICEDRNVKKYKHYNK